MHIRNEIRQHIRQFDRVGNSPAADFLFPEDFTGFSGHFRGQPVLPGVCLIEAATVMLEAWHSQDIVVHQVTGAKFTRMILPNQSIRLRCLKFACGDNGGNATVICEHDSARAAEFALDYDFTQKK